MPWKQAPRVLKWIALALLLGVVVASRFSAFLYPVELEYREGSAWVAVLAQREGVNIHGTAQAFTNMNHGPLDVLLKGAVGRVFPFLPPQMVTRIFVLLMPLGLIAALRGSFRKSWLDTAIWALALDVFLLGIWPPLLLVGRSDATALLLLGLMLWAYWRALEHPQWGWTSGLGAIGSLVILTNWRFATVVGPVGIAFLAESALRARAPDRRNTLGRALLRSVAGALAGATLVLIWAYGYHWSRYVHECLDFFLAKNGWGAIAGVYQTFPSYAVRAHLPSHLLALSLLVIAYLLPSSFLPRRMQVAAWYPVLALLWLAGAYSYHLNWSGGGVYYFAPTYVVFTVFIARAIAWERLRPSHSMYVAIPQTGNPAPDQIAVVLLPTLARLILLALFFCLPWSSVMTQAEGIAEGIRPARDFLAQVNRISAGAPIHSEGAFLFERRYRGELVDSGEVADALLQRNYFEPSRAEVARRQFAQTAAHPPAFIMRFGPARSGEAALVDSSYDPVVSLTAKGVPTASFFVLYRLRQNRWDPNLPRIPLDGPIAFGGEPARIEQVGAVRAVLEFPPVNWLRSKADNLQDVLNQESAPLADANHQIVELQRLVGDLQKDLIATQKALRDSESKAKTPSPPATQP